MLMKIPTLCWVQNRYCKTSALYRLGLSMDRDREQVCLEHLESPNSTMLI